MRILPPLRNHVQRHSNRGSAGRRKPGFRIDDLPRFRERPERIGMYLLRSMCGGLPGGCAYRSRSHQSPAERSGKPGQNCDRTDGSRRAGCFGGRVRYSGRQVRDRENGIGLAGTGLRQGVRHRFRRRPDDHGGRL